ncbi:CaiB/BaiF CoA transferase family protein [Nocardioides zeae]|uniref:Crotonobetainyl-CoA:carnitine CoA-transferase CaiB-like acyl-CoA transferase n=1 Tax=Nocardioides zeae TaxID=1457234 RepID=A0AAJ1U723_9ACTN|nr:CoA transferase [Nocardioides zeae]MDQ1105701.1 crotonobetainyl-CoA:carnitine CoA-transferase CaiB-like acyl-CoA transferase [Nocardioides zeae]
MDLPADTSATTGPPEPAGPGSLGDIRVLDITTNVAGPFATQVLGDLGADVIKVERPSGGDDTRGWGPPYWPNGESVTFSTLNRNKRSLALDLSSDEGRERLRGLVAEADVLVENMRPGAMDRLGFGDDALRALNPRLVVCHITGFGPGPSAAKPAYDPLMQAFSGLMGIVGEPGRAPVRIPVSVLDKGAGMWAVIGILNALRLREQTGAGSVVATSLLETALQWEPAQLLGVLADGSVAGQLGSATLGIAPYQAFLAQDRHLVIAVGNERLWSKFTAVMGREDWRTDERFVDNGSRFRNREVLAEEIEVELKSRPAQEWIATFEAVGIPCSLIRRVDEVLRDEQVVATGAVAPLEHPEVPAYATVHTPVRTDGEHFALRRRPPVLGEHSLESFEGSASRQERR